jgi:hypothetical protein
MALVVYDRVQETTSTTGTGSVTLDGAVSGFQSFAVVGNGNTTFYTIVNGNQWEVGLGTYTSSGTTLSRDTIYSNSNGNTSPITLSGSSFVFVTYPAGRSVNLNASGNVTALGTVSSGTWQGSTVGVAYGGTGVTASSGANSVMLRDSNQNVAVNRLNQANTSTTAAGGTTALTGASTYIHSLVGTGGQTYTLPDATTLATGVAFLFNNLATGTLTIQDYATGPIGTIPTGGAGAVFLTNNGTTGGTWDLHAYLPEGVTFGTNAFNLGTAIVSGGTWQGGTVQPAYGGTGLTTFTGANNALYSSGASTLTAGTLPVAAGGTGVTSSTGSGSNVLNTSPTLVTPVLGTPSSGTLTSCTGLPLTTGVTGTLSVANGGTGATTLTANNVLLGNGTSAVQTVAPGTNGNVLTSNGTTWASTAPAAGTTFSAGTTGFTPSTATSGAVTLAGTLAVANGGTGQTSYTNGQLLIGNTTGNTLTKATLTPGLGISITNGTGSITITNTAAPYNASYVIIAGGGSGGGAIGSDTYASAGGGAGGYLSGTQTLLPGTTYSFTVGAGGVTTNEGGNSTGFGLTAIGGAPGVPVGAGNSKNGGSGGGGGDGVGTGGDTTGGTGTVGQGNNGGNASGAQGQSGGGGGAGAAGSGAQGGVGLSSSITGSAVFRGGGGSGTTGTTLTGGNGGGGSGGLFANSTAGTANTGGGGGGSRGGSGATQLGKNGGSGVVILSMPTANYTGTTTGSPTVTTSGSNTILQFNSSGSYTA